jgi:hypothetical protein
LALAPRWLEKCKEIRADTLPWSKVNDWRAEKATQVISLLKMFSFCVLLASCVVVCSALFCGVLILLFAQLSWTAEQWAFLLASAEMGLRHEVRDDMSAFTGCGVLQLQEVRCCCCVLLLLLFWCFVLFDFFLFSFLPLSPLLSFSSCPLSLADDSLLGLDQGPRQERKRRKGFNQTETCSDF